MPSPRPRIRAAVRLYAVLGWVLFVVFVQASWFGLAAPVQDTRRSGEGLPEGSGQLDVQRHCTVCHDLERITNQRKSASAWEATVTDMLGRLAPGMIEEGRTISRYLSKHFGLDSSGSLARVLKLLERGEQAEAAQLVREGAASLETELEQILEQMDRGFDELGRQKARADVLDDKFDRFDSTWLPYEKVFQLYAESTGQDKKWIRFRAKRLRVEGARHTTSADYLWDQLQYRESLEEYDRAIGKLKQAKSLAQAADDQKLVAACLTNIGYAEIYSDNHPEGLRTYREALRIAEQREDEVFQGMYLLNLSTYYLYTLQARKGLEYALRASQMNAQTGRKTWEANSLLNAGSAFLNQGKWEQAHSYLQKALLKAKESRDARSHGRILYNLALIQAQFGRIPEAASVMEQALDWYSNNEVVYNQGEQALVHHRGLQFLISAHLKLNQRERAQHFTELLSELRQGDPQQMELYLADPHLNFAKWDEFRGRFGPSSGPPD